MTISHNIYCSVALYLLPIPYPLPLPTAPPIPILCGNCLLTSDNYYYVTNFYSVICFLDTSALHLFFPGINMMYIFGLIISASLGRNLLMNKSSASLPRWNSREGFTSACFHGSGKVPVSSMVLTMWWIGIKRSSRLSMEIHAGKSSELQAFFCLVY